MLEVGIELNHSLGQRVPNLFDRQKGLLPVCLLHFVRVAWVTPLASLQGSIFTTCITITLQPVYITFSTYSALCLPALCAVILLSTEVNHNC